SVPARANANTAVTDAGLIEVVDVNAQRVMASSSALEGPLTTVLGNARANIAGRTIAVDAQGQNAYVLTASGISIIPLTPLANSAAPAFSNPPVLNSANFTAAVAPGGLISVMGRNLAGTESASSNPLPNILGN